MKTRTSFTQSLTNAVGKRAPILICAASILAAVILCYLMLGKFSVYQETADPGQLLVAIGIVSAGFFIWGLITNFGVKK